MGGKKMEKQIKKCAFMALSIFSFSFFWCIVITSFLVLLFSLNLYTYSLLLTYYLPTYVQSLRTTTPYTRAHTRTYKQTDRQTCTYLYIYAYAHTHTHYTFLTYLISLRVPWFLWILPWCSPLELYGFPFLFFPPTSF